MADYNLRIDTPENLELEAEVAGFGSRSVAALVDYGLLGLLMTLFTCGFIRLAAESYDETQVGVLLAVFTLILFALFTFYHLTFEFLWNGQTPGKRLFGLRVVMQDGLPATTTALLIRNFIRLFDFLPFFYGVGLITLFWARKTQRLGDMAARTVVIYERPQLTLQALQNTTRFQYLLLMPGDALPPYLNIHRLSTADRARLTEYLQRRALFVERQHLAVMLAAHLATQIELSEAQREELGLQRPRHAERFIEMLALLLERQANPQPESPTSASGLSAASSG
ncbi:MAG: RDD family protein [Anaerolineae bacterium]|nr:RDD family protein [Anaerolineae bacterium]